MRPGIIFFGLLVLTVAQPSRGGIVEDIDKVIENAVTNANNELDNVVSLLKEFTSNTSSKSDSIITAAKNELSTAITGIETMIQGLVAKGGTIASCAQTATSDVTQLEAVMAKNFVVCTGNLAEALSSFEENIQGDITNLKSTVSQLTGLVESCSENAIEAMFCVATKVATLEELIGSTVTSAKLAIDSAENKMASTLDEIKSCTTKAISLASPKITQITSAVKQCI